MATLYINGHLTLDGSITFQVTSDGSPTSLLRIGFHVACGDRKPRRRDIFKAVEKAVDANASAWLAPGRNGWILDVPALRTVIADVGHLSWLSDAQALLIEPEFEEDERESFGIPSFRGSVFLHVDPESLLAPPEVPSAQRMKILVFHGPDNESKHELLAWLRGPDIQADARTVGEMAPHSQGVVDDRVDQAMAWADRAIAIVAPDPRSPSGSLNVVDEIARWRGSGRAAELSILRHRDCADLWSNLAGVVRIEYSDRVKETFLGLARFLEMIGPRRK